MRPFRLFRHPHVALALVVLDAAPELHLSDGGPLRACPLGPVGATDDGFARRRVPELDGLGGGTADQKKTHHNQDPGTPAT